MKCSYDHLLTNKITQSSNRKRNERLYSRVMAGDQQAREEIIEGNMPLIVSKVDSYIRHYPQLEYLRHDLHSAGFVGLVKAVNKMAEHNEPAKANPTGYISISINHEFVKLATKEASHSNIELADTHEDGMDAEDDEPEVLHNIPKSVVDINQSAAAGLIELRDMLNACCQCEEERTLLRMREEGYSDREIAKTLNMPHTDIYTLRKELEKRFNQKYRGLED